MADVDIILIDIIRTEMSLAESRVAAYAQNWKSPIDQNIYIIVALQSTRIIGSVNKFDPATDKEIKSTSMSETYNIEITSKNRDAQTRYHEVIMALTSDYSEQQQELNQIKIFRTGQILDLSLIEASSSLHRYRIPVIINSVKIKENDIIPFEHFQTPQEVIE